MTAWEPHELGEFVDAIQGERLQAVWHLLALSGMRRGEVLGLLWSDIDLKKGKIHVRMTRIRAGNRTIEETPKSKKSRRTISIDPRTIKILEKWRLNQTKERFAVGELWSDKEGHLVTEPDVGGAALVQLRSDASGDPGRPRIQEQSALGDGAWLIDEIAAAIARVRAEDFPAVISSDCRTCPYAVACPAQPAGREVLA